MSIGGVSVKASSKLRNLGAIWDSAMTMHSQMKSVKRSMYCYISTINKIRRFLDRETCIRAVMTLVISRLDYVNCLLLGQSQSALHGLQVAQNSAARVITRTGKREHITPVLKDLHWLPVHQRVKYKTLCLVYKALHSDESPSYMTGMLAKHQGAGRNLRSGSMTARLEVARSTNKHGDCCFSIEAPRLWNSLPCSMHKLTSYNAFRAALKTFLFRQHYV